MQSRLQPTVFLLGKSCQAFVPLLVAIPVRKQSVKVFSVTMRPNRQGGRGRGAGGRGGGGGGRGGQQGGGIPYGELRGSSKCAQRGLTWSQFMSMSG